MEKTVISNWKFGMWWLLNWKGVDTDTYTAGWAA